MVASPFVLKSMPNSGVEVRWDHDMNTPNELEEVMLFGLHSARVSKQWSPDGVLNEVGAPIREGYCVVFQHWRAEDLLFCACEVDTRALR